GSDDERIDAAIAATRRFFEQMGVPTHLSDYGLDGSTIPALLAVRTEKPTGKGVMTDVDFHAFGGAGASPVKQFTRPERVGVV
ncbi:hypothetical protein ONN26_26050, partial [Salmonella enterica subsp. enterica serovar Muenster]|nr:hypothetical protein [Salmonella enterica subsp. enterica serovar Muenster]